MRKPTTVEHLYLDFDGFFASVEQLADKRLRGRPVGVVPFSGTDRTTIIACSREAKLRGVKSVMPVREARALCPDIVLVPQQPDLYRRAHNHLVAEIDSVLPVEVVKSIDELSCRLDATQRQAPEEVAARIKARLAKSVGKVITSSIGVAANRQLAKIACKAGKWTDHGAGLYGDGLAIWHPANMPGPLLKVQLQDIPGVGGRMYQRLLSCGIATTADLYNTAPRQMRALWKSVHGERLWYALHGYEVSVPTSQRGMFGHSRVLPPDSRKLDQAYEIARMLMIKAARRLRRDNYAASAIGLRLVVHAGPWMRWRDLPQVTDDHSILSALASLWQDAERELSRRAMLYQVGVTLGELSPANQRQLDILAGDDRARRRWEAATRAVDALNNRYDATVVSLGLWRPPAGGHVGGKISFTRIPSAEDFR